MRPLLNPIKPKALYDYMHITELTLYTPQLLAQKEFYIKTLAFSLVEESSNSFVIQCGYSRLRFVNHPVKTQYHFAFNIPSNQIKPALEWIKKRAKLLPFEGKEIIDFPDWNAEAVYFYDTDLNIVEIIARKNLEMNSNQTFSSQSIQCISEVGIPTLNLKSLHDTLNKVLKAEIYSGNFHRFCAIGTETGLVIGIDYTVKKWIPTMEVAHPYPLSFELENDQKRRFYFTYQKDYLLLNR